MTNAKTIWEVMKIHNVTFEYVTDGIDITEEEKTKLKKEVETFSDNVEYPYIIESGSHNMVLNENGVSEVLDNKDGSPLMPTIHYE